MATVIDIRTRKRFETAPYVPSFPDWMRERFPRGYAVVKVRNYKRGWRGFPWPEGITLLLPREHNALEREYEATFGVHPYRISA